MRSWSQALYQLNRDYPDMDGEIIIDRMGATVHLKRWVNGKYSSVTRKVLQSYQNSSYIDLVLHELAYAASQLLLVPQQHAAGLTIVGGKDVEVRRVVERGDEPGPDAA